MRPAVMAVLLATVGVTLSTAQPVEITRGFWKGNDFLKGDAARQRAYAAGLADGLSLAPLFGAPEHHPNLTSVERCMVGMTDHQVAAILRKELQDNPGVWHEAANTVFFRAMKAACRF